MPNNDAIINPVKGNSSPNPGSFAVLVATRSDLFSLCRLMHFKKEKYLNLFTSRLYIQKEAAPKFSLVGPLLGAPYAAMLIETLAAWGVRKFIFFGWCGSISLSLRIGDIVVPTAAFIDEGTSRNYDAMDDDLVEPDTKQLKYIRQALRNSGLFHHEGSVWSTDAIFRETREKVMYYQNKKALAVEMETSALFSIGKFRHIAVSAIHVVSDELSDYQWRPGFKCKKFKKSRDAVCGALRDLCLKIQ